MNSSASWPMHLADASLVKPAGTADLSEPAKRAPSTYLKIDKARHDLDYRPRSVRQNLKPFFRHTRLIFD